MEYMVCVVTDTRLEAAGRLLKIWINKGVRFEIVPATVKENIGKIFYMERKLDQ